MRRCLAVILFVLLMLLALTACSSDVESGESQSQADSGESSAVVELTQEQQERMLERVSELLVESSDRLCTTQSGLEAIRTMTFALEEQTEIDGQLCYVVRSYTQDSRLASGSFAIAADGETLYEWEPVSESYIQLPRAQ